MLGVKVCGTLKLLAAALLAVVAPSSASAQSWPSKPVHLIMPAPPGGNNDSVGRVLAQAMSAILKVGVVVENKTGGGGLPAIQHVLGQPADGHTLFFGVTGPISIIPHMKKGLPYDPQRDFAPVSMVATTPLVLVATKAFETRDIDSYLAKVRASPGRYNFASPGIGTINHIAMEALRIRAKLDMAHVPYSNAPMIQPLLANDVQTAYDALPASAPHIESGALLPLMVTGNGRAAMLPSTPHMSEKGYPGMETMVAWMGLLAPRGTPDAAIAVLNAAVRQSLADPEVRARMARLGADPVFGPPAEMAKFMGEASAFYKEIIETAKITAD